MIKKLFGVFYLLSMITQTHTTAPLEEIAVQEPVLTVILDRKVQHLCRSVVDMWERTGFECPDEDLKTLLDPNIHELDYETALSGLHQCVHSGWEPCCDEGRGFIKSLNQIYAELTREYDELIKQQATRRIKCKCYSKVTTSELAACNATIKNKLIVDKLNGAVQANNGCLTAGQLNGNLIEDGTITTDKLADNSVTNSKLADNSVTSDKIVDMNVLPAKLSFNTVDTFPSEPDLLRIYRGSITAAGAIASGTGFMVAHVANSGLYTFTLSDAYASTTSYQVFVQPTTTVDRRVTISQTSSTVFTVQIVDDASANVDQNFSIYVIGDRPA